MDIIKETNSLNEPITYYVSFSLIGLSCMTVEGALVTLCKDHNCTKDCITADLNENNYMPVGKSKHVRVSDMQGAALCNDA